MCGTPFPVTANGASGGKMIKIDQKEENKNKRGENE